MKKVIISTLVVASAYFMGSKLLQTAVDMKYPVRLMKVYVEDAGIYGTVLFSRGEKFELARIESTELCLSIAKAYNFARLDETGRGGSFGINRLNYHFQCE